VATGLLRTKSRISGEHAAKILRPGPVGGHVDEYVPDLLRSDLVAYGGRDDGRIELARFELANQFRLVWNHDPLDVAARIEAHVADDGGEKAVIRVVQRGDGDRLALEVANRADRRGGDQLLASGMHSGEHRDRGVRISLKHESRAERHAQVDLVGCERVIDVGGVAQAHVLEIREALAA
jgi:hypothetical protein